MYVYTPEPRSHTALLFAGFVVEWCGSTRKKGKQWLGEKV